MNVRNYLLFLDECGTHDMRHVQAVFPIFTLAGLLVGESYYAKTLVPRMKALKKLIFNDESVILHSRDIRRQSNEFRVFRNNQELKSLFYQELNRLFASARIRLYAVIVDKTQLLRKFIIPMNPYDVSLHQLLSLICGPVGLPSRWRPNITCITAESRGKREDKELQAEFQRIRKHGAWNHGGSVQNRLPSTIQRTFPIRVTFHKKSKGITGLELVDLAAYPISRATINNNWENPSAQILAKKFQNRIIHF